MDFKTSFILVQNDTTKILQILRNFRFGYVTEFDYFNVCYVTGKNAQNLVLRRPEQEQKINWFKKIKNNMCNCCYCRQCYNNSY